MKALIIIINGEEIVKLGIMQEMTTSFSLYYPKASCTLTLLIDLISDPCGAHDTVNGHY